MNFIEFQSLFFWNHYLDIIKEKQAKISSIVSILVFLEPLLRLVSFQPYKYIISVSILVFLEPLLRRYFTRGIFGHF